MRISVVFVYIFIGVAFTFVVFTAAMLVSNYLADPKYRKHFKRFANASIVINPYYVVSVDLVSPHDAGLELRFHLTKDSDKPSFDHPFTDGQTARQAFNEIAEYLEAF